MSGPKKGGGCIGCFGVLIVIGILICLIETVVSFFVKNSEIIATILFAIVLFLGVYGIVKKKKSDCMDYEESEMSGIGIKTNKPFDVEQYAKECNAYVIREERKERERLESERIKNKNDSKEDLAKSDELKEISNEISNILKDYGNIYVNLFNDRFYVNSCLIDSRNLDNKSTEFIIKCETLEQAKYVVMHENELNQNLKSIHKMTLLANNCISLIVTR